MILGQKLFRMDLWIRDLVKIGIVATVTVGDMDVAVEPSGMSLRRVTGKTMTINAA